MCLNFLKFASIGTSLQRCHAIPDIVLSEHFVPCFCSSRTGPKVAPLLDGEQGSVPSGLAHSVIPLAGVAIARYNANSRYGHCLWRQKKSSRPCSLPIYWLLISDCDGKDPPVSQKL